MSKLTWGGVRPHVAASRRSMRALPLALLLGGIAIAPGARAFEFQDGRLQIHGYFEEQIRALGQDFSWSDDIDLAQWYNVLSTEIEYDFAPDGIGPFDVLSGFMRLEVRYDCVWTRACGMFPSVNSFGNRVTHLPGYKTTGRRSGFSGSLSIADQPSPLGVDDKTARFTQLRYKPFEKIGTNPCDAREQIANPIADERCRALYTNENPRRPLRIDQLDGFTGLFAVAGANANFEASGAVTDPIAFSDGPDTNAAPDWRAANDDPAYFYFSKQLNCRFGARKVPGGANGVANQIIGPIDPDCDIDPSGALHFKPNPFNSGDASPLLVNPDDGSLGFGGAELPGRPASEVLSTDRGSDTMSQGVYYPSKAFRKFLKSGDPSVFDQNFSQNELAWNRGGSQQDEKELKELYLDMEFFDSRLWIRLGKQNIVWGKTELFRTTDQFNPADLALASLPSLEESRIALWSVRGIWSFYDVGPMEDVRLELAANIDDNEPADIGRCGEPFTALVACNKTTALWAHGLFGVALAGEHRPEGWWKSPSGLEYGARLEFRMGRFSFQVSDFYGFEDFPFVNRITSYERKVDVETGRPMRVDGKGGCETGFEDGCLPLQSNLSLGPEDPKASDPAANRGDYSPTNSGISGADNATPRSRTETLSNFATNMQIFAAICATSIGFNDVDLSACGQSIFNSQKRVPTLDIDITEAQRKTGLSVAQLLANTLGGNAAASATVSAGFTSGALVPYVRLNTDPCDAFFSDGQGGCTTTLARGRTLALGNPTLNVMLTDEQEALLGCGPFWGTDCEADGIDLLNMEASVVMQSWPGIEGDYGKWVRDRGFLGYSIGGVDGDGDLLPVPGTVGFKGAVPGGRWFKNKLVALPGARGPGQRGYNPAQDGCVGPGEFGCNAGDDIDGAGPIAARAAAALQLAIPNYNDPGSGTVNGFRGATGRRFKNEMAALSWNFLHTLVAFSSATDPTNPDDEDFDPANPVRRGKGLCSFAQPQYCSSVVSFFSITGAQRSSLRAGGNGDFGRRDFQWHAGGEGVLEYQKRNVLGFSTDFAEDVTKSNWSMEATWISNVRFTDNNSLQGVNTADTFNLTVSADRPTFINFLNQNRTFFFNSQVFFQYINNYKSGFVNNGPFNMLGTFTVQTGYFQDRLLPGITFVYDLNSNSGAALPAITYRFTENFSATVGMNFFWGRWEYEDSAIAPLGTLGNEVGSLAYRDGVENGLSVVRERDEVFLRLRYTF